MTTQKISSRTLNLAFNERELNKFLKAAKKGRMFFYTAGEYFSNGLMLLADNPQLTAFMKKEFMVITNLWFRDYQQVHSDPLKAVKAERIPLANIEAEITDYILENEHARLNGLLYRIFKSKNGNFLIDEKFIKFIYKPQSKDLKYFTNKDMTCLLVKTTDDEFIAYFLGIRTGDIERRLLDKDVEELEAAMPNVKETTNHMQ